MDLVWVVNIMSKNKLGMRWTKVSLVLLRLETKIIAIEINCKERVSFKTSIFWRLTSIKVCPPSNVFFNKKSSSLKGQLPLKFVLNPRLSSIKSNLSAFHLRLSFRKGHLQSKGVLHLGLSSIKGCVQLKSIEGCFPSKFVNCQNPNLTSTQRLGLTWKWLYNHHHHHPRKLNVSNISAVTDTILMKL